MDSNIFLQLRSRADPAGTHGLERSRCWIVGPGGRRSPGLTGSHRSPRRRPDRSPLATAAWLSWTGRAQGAGFLHPRRYAPCGPVRAASEPPENFSWPLPGAILEELLPGPVSTRNDMNPPRSVPRFRAASWGLGGPLGEKSPQRFRTPLADSRGGARVISQELPSDSSSGSRDSNVVRFMLS